MFLFSWLFLIVYLIVEDGEVLVSEHCTMLWYSFAIAVRKYKLSMKQNFT